MLECNFHTCTFVHVGMVSAYKDTCTCTDTMYVYVHVHLSVLGIKYTVLPAYDLTYMTLYAIPNVYTSVNLAAFTHTCTRHCKLLHIFTFCWQLQILTGWLSFWWSLCFFNISLCFSSSFFLSSSPRFFSFSFLRCSFSISYVLKSVRRFASISSKSLVAYGKFIYVYLQDIWK